MGTCRYCGQNAGFLRKQHGQCRDLHTAGIREMTQIAAQAAGSPEFNETVLRSTLRAIATRAGVTEDEVSSAISAGWIQGVNHALSDGILTRDEEDHLRNFRDQLAIGDLPSVTTGSGTLERAAAERDTTEARRAAERVAAEERHAAERAAVDARRAALATGDGGSALKELENTVQRLGMSPMNRRQLLVRAWEEAVERAIEDGVITLDEENALEMYLDQFGLSTSDVNVNGAHTGLVQAGVIRDIAQGVVPHRQKVSGPIPFNLMKSEQLVWVIDGVDYLETVTRRERRGTSHGVSVRVVRGLYYRPSTFRSRSVEWDETVHADTGLLGLTTKHIYFAGPEKRFRVRYDRIVAFEPYSDGLGIMRDAQVSRAAAKHTTVAERKCTTGVMPEGADLGVGVATGTVVGGPWEDYGPACSGAEDSVAFCRLPLRR